MSELIFTCICGEEFEKQTGSDSFLLHTRHADEGEHKIEKITNTETKETVSSVGEATKKGWLMTPGEKKKIKEERAAAKEGETLKTHILGEIPYTDVLVHPYWYEMFRQFMVLFPDKYPEDTKENFSRFMAFVAVDWRMKTQNEFDWDDNMAKSLANYLGINQEGE